MVQAGSVRAGAAARGVTPAAISRNLVALERDCKSTLLIRGARGIQLTDAGRLLLRRARVVVSELRRAEEELAALTQAHTPRVELAISNVAEAMLLPAALQRYLPRYPSAQVQIIGAPFMEALSMLREGQCDFAVGTAEPDDLPDDLSLERLFSVDLIVICRKGHPMANATDLRDLAEFGWLGAGSEAERILATAFEEVGVTPFPCRIRRGSILGMVSLLISSDYLSVATPQTVKVFHDAGLIDVIPIPLAFPPIIQYLASVSHRPLTAAAESLATEIRRVAWSYRR